MSCLCSYSAISLAFWVQVCHHYWIWVCDWLLDCYRNTARPCTEFFAGRSQSAYANTKIQFMILKSVLLLWSLPNIIRLENHENLEFQWNNIVYGFAATVYSSKNRAMPNSVHIATLKGVSWLHQTNNAGRHSNAFERLASCLLWFFGSDLIAAAGVRYTQECMIDPDRSMFEKQATKNTGNW